MPKSRSIVRSAPFIARCCGLLPALLFSSGCGGGAGVPSSAAGTVGTNGAPDVSSTGLVDASIFIEDANPVVAALPFVENQLIVRTLPGAGDDELAAAFEEAGAAASVNMPELSATVVEFEAGGLAAVAATLAGHPLIEGVQKNYLFEPALTPNDAQYASQEYLEAIDVPAAWDVTTGDPAQWIAVLDTGVDAGHPDLDGRVRTGWNALDDSDMTGDANGHGTAVAGVIGAATNNAAGLAGVCWRNPILPVRIADDQGRASTVIIAQGIRFAADHGAKVINISFAPMSADRTVLAAAEYARNAGALVFIASGNDGRALPDSDNPSAIFVGAVDDSAALASFSNTGAFVDLTAPGVRIVTPSLDDAYSLARGTSVACPLVAAVAALVWSVQPDLRPATVESLLRSTSIDLGRTGRDDSYGAGLVQAGAAVGAALQTLEEADTTAPTLSMSKPREGDRVTRVLDVRVSAADANGVADVVLFVDGVAQATDTTSPYRFGISTSRLTAGTHTVGCVATDASGNASSLVSVRVTLGDGGSTSPPADLMPPAVVINFPLDGTRVLNSVGIQATATDNAGLARIDWLVDGAHRQQSALAGTRAVASFVWNARSASSGHHTITARVTDAGGNQASATVSLVR